MKYSIVVTNTELHFDLLLNYKIEANDQMAAVIKMQTDPPAFIPEFMYGEPFKLLSK